MKKGKYAKFGGDLSTIELDKFMKNKSSYILWIINFFSSLGVNKSLENTICANNWFFAIFWDYYELSSMPGLKDQKGSRTTISYY